jgi:hypothetical protein
MLDMTTTTALGPAIVREVNGASIVALMEGREIEAVNAMAFPYTPKPGDVVLAIGQPDKHYVIGVLQAQGDMTMTFPANVNLRAPKGHFNFSSGEAIEMHAPEVKVTAGKWTLLARTLTENVTDAMRWVANLSQLKAGRKRTLVEGKDYERAERKIVKAKKDVRLNGERIHLG